MSSAVDPAPVEVRHDLANVPLTPPSRTSGVLEVFRKRYLLRLMVRREIQARYAGTGFGLAWSYIEAEMGKALKLLKKETGYTR